MAFADFPPHVQAEIQRRADAVARRMLDEQIAAAKDARDGPSTRTDSKEAKR